MLWARATPVMPRLSSRVAWTAQESHQEHPWVLRGCRASGARGLQFAHREG